jgi:hypothetical protein
LFRPRSSHRRSTRRADITSPTASRRPQATIPQPLLVARAWNRCEENGRAQSSQSSASSRGRARLGGLSGGLQGDVDIPRQPSEDPQRIQ